jgi:hypothetical protein
MSVQTRDRSNPTKYLKRLEARVGFEPTNGGFADLSLGPLGYRAEFLSIANLTKAIGHPGATLILFQTTVSPPEEPALLRAGIALILLAALD